MGLQELEKIEGKIDKVVAGATEISMQFGGIRFQTMTELFEMAKMMAVARTAVPKHLRENPGSCLAVCIQALEWRMSPFSVANKSYEVNDRIGYEAQLIVAVINARAPLQERLRYEYEGEGVELKCKVLGLIKGEAKPLDYESPRIREIKVKNSPLWTSDPRQQLGYYSARAWARRHCPETILGIYSDDELRDGEPMQDVTPKKPDVAERLKNRGTRGFSEEHVAAQIGHDKDKKALNVVGDSGTAEKVTLSATDTPAAEQQMSLEAGSVETEIAQKKLALENVESKDDLAAIVSSATAYLRENNRTALLNDFLSVADKRGKKMKV